MARPAYVWSGTEWVPVGPVTPTSPFFYQATAPSSPATGDVWIDSDATTVPLNSNDFLTKTEASAFFKHYEYTATAGQTTFTGADNNGASLAYIANAIGVYLNGVLLQPGDDYTATNGTSVVLVSGATEGDALAIIAFSAFSLANTYSQTQIDANFATKTELSSVEALALLGL